ncbi:phage tail protein [Leuconostoc gelidum subsp. gasicomitatum]|uniref:phage tail tube protein n=1 Tax=Leuconostoc gasicomitatum TaxID=115778 RepID=UPI001CC6EBBD|nr:phage tail tube protein [Leuconostoc gasicomitatum]MBZ5952914.1 phage tail protein [Leuconostoc gasicomitatum]MBZ5968846.1 phage tail protein [Leuconostoc gasicomitatum]
MANQVILNQQDTINSKEGMVVVKIDGKNYPFIEATEVSAQVDFNKEDVQRLGTRFKGSKVTSVEGTGTINGYLVSSIWVSDVLENYKNTGVLPEMSLTVTVEDKTSAVGKQVIVLTGFMIDTVPLFALAADDGVMMGETDFTFDDYQMTNKFAGPKRA